MKQKDLFFEDLNIGDEIPALINRITLVQMVMYAAATWDFHRHHYDKEFAQSKGFPAPFVDGQMFGAFLSGMITNWAGPNVAFKKLRLTYRVMVFSGDTIACKGSITGKYKEGSENLVSCKLWIENQRGEKNVATGTALIALPSKL